SYSALSDFAPAFLRMTSTAEWTPSSRSSAAGRAWCRATKWHGSSTSAIWVLLFIGAGYYFGSMHRVEENLTLAQSAGRRCAGMRLAYADV
ncbi:MAG: hypothetical protein KJ747_03025, partial [Actinobacteria bacterium]|nr:hypothetical protein [Actinomycetota bacterium]